MTITGNYRLVKRINKSLILKNVRIHSPLSRAELSKITGLNKTTVSALVSELLDEQLLFESGPGASKGGRRPVMLNFNGGAGHAIGIDLGVNYLSGILTDLQGNIIFEESVALTDSAYPRVLDQMDQLVQNLTNLAPSSPYGIIGIGVGIPGIVDQSGRVLLAPNLGWRDLPLQEILRERWSIPVILQNEANAGAYGEKVFGMNDSSDDLVYISAGIGLGTGIILNGELFQGIGGYAGEMGHMTIEPDGKACRCGSRGCWELYASEQAVLARAKAFKRDKPKALPLCETEITLENLVELAATDHPQVIELFTDAGRYLGLGISNIINTFNPGKVVIGNRLALAKKWLKNPICDIIQTHTLDFHRHQVTVSFSKLRHRSCSIGMSCFTIEKFLNEVPPLLKE